MFLATASRALDTMATRIFWVLLLGFVGSGWAAMMWANSTRGTSLETLQMVRAAARVSEHVQILDAPLEQVERERQLAALPGIRSADRHIAGVQANAELKGYVEDEFDGRFEVLAFDAPTTACFPMYRVDGLPPARRPEWRMRPPSCWHVVLEGDGARSFLVESPMTIINEPPVIDWRFLTALSFAALALSLVISRLVNAPLARLAQAAAKFGQDANTTPLIEEGPREVRETANAFNRMQAELRTYIRNRTVMLASVSHDLQTPLTRMRLRIDQVGDPDLRMRLLHDWRAMSDLVGQGLSVARTSEADEEAVLVDLDSLIESVVDDANAAGLDAVYEASSELEAVVPPVCTARILMNLITNAAKYAGRARLAVDSVDDWIRVSVLDRGPGLDPEQLDALAAGAAAAKPIRSTEGAGFGLTIASLLAERFGAHIEFSNREGGGLAASLVIPVR